MLQQAFGTGSSREKCCKATHRQGCLLLPGSSQVGSYIWRCCCMPLYPDPGDALVGKTLSVLLLKEPIMGRTR